MWLVFLFLIVILGIVYSKLEVNLYHVVVQEKDWDFNTSIAFKFFGFLTICVFKIDKKYIRFLHFKMPYKKMISKEKMKQINKDALEILKKLHLQLDKVNFDLRIKLVDIVLKNLVIILFSSVFPNFIKNRIEPKKVKYKILPDSSKMSEESILLNLELTGEIRLSIKSLKIVKLYFENINNKIAHNKNKNYGVKESF